MTRLTITITIDVEYEVEDETALLAAASNSLGPDADVRDSIAQLIEDRFTEQALDLDGARVTGHVDAPWLTTNADGPPRIAGRSPRGSIEQMSCISA